MSSPRTLRLLVLGTTALACAWLVGCSDDEPPTGPSSPHVARLRVRVVVTDARTPDVHVYDVADRELVGRLTLDAPADTLVSSHTGDTAVVVQRGTGSVRVLGGGVSVIPHRDHIHIFKSAPELLGDAVGGGTPTTATFARGAWGLFFGAEPDPGGHPGFVARAVAEEPWLQGSRVATAVALGSPAHHGFTLPFGDAYLVTRAGASSAADGAELVSGSNAQPVVACPEIDAATTNGDAAVFSCREGLVVFGSDRVASAPVPFPDRARPRELVALPEQPVVLGRDPAGKVVALDLVRRSAAVLPVDGEVCDAVLEIAQAPHAVVLTSAGRAERFDLRTMRRISTAAATPPFACADAERPRLAATPGRAWITSPSTGELLEIDTDAGRPLGRVSLGGTPALVAALGLDARNADLATGNDKLSD